MSSETAQVHCSCQGLAVWASMGCSPAVPRLEEPQSTKT